MTTVTKSKHRRPFKLRRPTLAEVHLWVVRSSFSSMLLVLGFIVGVASQR
jgi:hypothetical protein